MNICLTIDGKAITATLVDNATTRDFLALLPLSVTLEDYAGTEKISYLPRKLSTGGAPPGSEPSIGDIAYYAPWGIWRSSTRTSVMRKGSLRWAASIPRWRLSARPVH
jgi:hypothetical protein